MYKIQISMVVAAIMLTACTFDEGVEPTEARTLYSELGPRVSLDLEPTSLVGVVAVDGQGNSLRCVQPNVTGGRAVLRSTKSGLLLVEDLEIDMSDIVIESGVVYEAPIELTEIRLTLGTQIAIDPTWSDDEAGGVASADLLLDWSVRGSNGDVNPLATKRMRDVEFKVDVALAPDGTITATVNTSVEGRLGGFANKIELSDFSMAVKAASPAIE